MYTGYTASLMLTVYLAGDLQGVAFPPHSSYPPCVLAPKPTTPPPSPPLNLPIDAFFLESVALLRHTVTAYSMVNAYFL